MKTLSIQILPDRLLSTDIQAMVGKLENLSSQATVQNSASDSGTDGNYINVNFVTSNVSALWKAIESTLSLLSSTPPPASNGIIVVCEGDHGWDDYLLLYHFDKNEAIDKLPTQ